MPSPIVYLIAAVLILVLIKRLRKTNNQKLVEMAKTPKKNKAIKDYIVQTAILRGARWFYWIAGVSAANSIFFISNGNLQFPSGLFIAQIVDIFAKVGKFTEVGLGINALLVALFVWIGYKATQFSKTAFIVGLILYILDSAILVLFMMIGKGLAELLVNIIFHLLALKSIYTALKLLQRKTAEQK